MGLISLSIGIFFIILPLAPKNHIGKINKRKVKKALESANKNSIPYVIILGQNEIDTNTNIDTGIEVGLQNFVVTSDESIDIKIDLIFKVSMSNNSRINVIDGVEIDENKNIYKYSMVIYFVKPGDSLWKIAKKFGSTVSAIAEVNNIEQVDNISVGQQLFIPRYNG